MGDRDSRRLRVLPPIPSGIRLRTALAVAAGVAAGAFATLAAGQTPPSRPPNAAPASTPASTLAPKLLDGEFDDWKTLSIISTTRDGLDALGGAPELLTVSLDCDLDSLWVYLEFRDEINLQALDHPLFLFVDADVPQQGASGGVLPGADFVIIFSPTDDERAAGAAKDAKSGKDAASSGPPRAKDHGQGVLVRRLLPDGSMGDSVDPRLIGLGMAPAHASRTFELHLDRGPTSFAGKSGSVRTAFLAKNAATGAVEALEIADPTRILLTPRPSDRPVAAPTVSADAVARGPDAALRVVTWNAELGALFDHPEAFAATISALRPDVVLWQELGKKATAESLAAWMNEHVRGDGPPWQAIVSGGDLRTGIVARTALAPAPFLDGLTWTAAKGRRDVRVAGAILERDGRRTLLASLHLKCCGRIGSSEDETRMGESKAIHDAIASATAKLAEAGTPLSGILVAGDFNLVGAVTPLRTTAAGIDLDGSDLDIVPAFHLDGRTNATWRSAGNDFLPGRLDWMLLSGSSMRVARTFVFSAEDLSTAAVAALSLPPSALKEPSDHRPVVADVTFSAAAPAAPAKDTHQP